MATAVATKDESTTGNKIMLTSVRLAFPNLWKATSMNGEGKPAFSCSLLIDPNDPQVNNIIRPWLLRAAVAKWGQKGSAMLQQLQKADKVCLHDGDSKSNYAGFEGMLFISARSATRPLVIDRDKSPLTESDGKPYAGCYVHCSVEGWGQDNAYGKRINAGLRGVQFVKDGDAFAGGGAASEDEFDAADGSDASDIV